MIKHILCEGNAVLNAENIGVEMETLRIARDHHEQPFVRLREAMSIVETLIKTLDPKDRERFQRYETGGIC